MAMNTGGKDTAVYVRLALVAVAWGGTFIAGRSLAGVCAHVFGLSAFFAGLGGAEPVPCYFGQGVQAG